MIKKVDVLFVLTFYSDGCIVVFYESTRPFPFHLNGIAMKFKAILLSFSLLVSVPTFADNHLDFTLSDFCHKSPKAEAQTKDGLYYHQGQEKPYSGENICFYTNGQLYYRGELKNGLFHGKMTEWYKNGQIALEVNFVDGKRKGKWASWHENGQKENEGNYKEDREDGEWTEWHENGQLMHVLYYLNGEINKWASWHENGQKWSEYYYLNGEINKSIFFDENGQKWSEYYYLSGEISKSTYWINDGTIIHYIEQTD